MQIQRQMHRKIGIYLLNAASKHDFSISECKYKGKMQMQRHMHTKMVFIPLMRHLSLECRFEAWFSRFQNANTKAKCLYQFKCIGKWFLCPKCGIYLLNARFEAWFSRFQNANTKAKCLYQFKCIGKWFLCPKCGIYLLNSALKRIFSISECKYKGKCLYQFKCIGKWFLCPKCGIYLLNAASKHDFLISECKYKGKMQRLRQMNRKMVFMP